MDEEKKNETNDNEIKEPKGNVVREINIEHETTENIDDEWDDEDAGNIIEDIVGNNKKEFGDGEKIDGFLDDETLQEEIDENRKYVKSDERFKIKERKKFENSQVKSIKKDRRKVKFVKLKNNLKLVSGSGLYNLLAAFSNYLDYLFNFATMASIVVGIGLTIKFLINENWIMSLVAIVFSIAMTLINEKIMKS